MPLDPHAPTLLPHTAAPSVATTRVAPSRRPRRRPPLLIALVLGLVLGAGAGGIQAARAHPWDPPVTQGSVPAAPGVSAAPRPAHPESSAPTPTRRPPPAPASPGPVSAPAPGSGPVASATLVVRAAPVMKVWIDGELRGMTPLEATLSAGPHALTFSNDRLGLSQARVVKLLPGRRAVEEWRPVRGRLTVTSSAPAEVKVDGEDLGPTPVKRAAVWEGRHRLEVEAEGGATRSREVVVPPGREARVQIRWDQP